MPARPDPTPVPFDVLVVLCAVGGPEALSAVLAALPLPVPAAVLIAAPLDAAVAVVDGLTRHLPLSVHRAEQGTLLQPGHVYVGPPRGVLEVRPGGHCAVTLPEEEPVPQCPLDRLLASLAVSSGPRTLAVLSGLTGDGVLGARALRGVGGMVLGQAPADPAEWPSALAEAGVTDRLLPPGELARTVADLLTGERPTGAADLQPGQALRESGERYRTLFTEMDEAYAVVEVLKDAAGHWADSRFLEVNGAFGRHTGMPYPVGRTATELLGTPNLRWAELYGRAVDTGESVRVEEGERTLGRVFDLNIFRLGDGGSRQVAVLFTDITERKCREANQQFLVDLTGELSRLSTEQELVGTVGVRLTTHLKLAGGPGEAADGDDTGATLRHFWQALDAPDVLDPAPTRAGFLSPDGLSRLHAGEVVVVGDGSANRLGDAGTDAQKIAAYVAVPYRQDGRWKACFVVADRRPRQWTTPEVELIREVAGRLFPRIERARAEAARREADEKYRTLFDTMAEGFAICGVVRDAAGRVTDLRYLELNRALERQTGLDRRALIGRRLSEVLPGAELERWMAVCAAVTGGGEPATFEDHVALLGRWFAVSVYPRAGDELAIFSRDVTERRRAEEVLRASEERQAFLLLLSDRLRTPGDERSVALTALRLLADHLRLDRACVAQLDPGRDRTDIGPESRRPDLPAAEGGFSLSAFSGAFARTESATLVLANTAADRALSARDRRDLAALRMGALVIAPAQGGTRGPVWALLAATEAPRQWTAAEVALVEEVAGRTWAAVERTRAEAALRESEARARTLIRNLPGGAAFILDRDLRYRLADGEALLAAGRAPQDYEGKTIAQAMPPELLAELEPALHRALAGEAFEVERTQDGLTFVSRGVPLRDAGREVAGVLIVSYDISARKRAEEELRAMNATLEQRVQERTRRLAELNAELASRTRALEAFAELTRDLAPHLDPYALIRRGQEIVLSLLPEGFATYYEPEGTRWRLRTQVGEMRNPALQAAVDAGLAVGGVPSLDRPWVSGTPLYQGHYRSETDGLDALEPGVDAVATVPLTVDGAPTGVFAVALFSTRVWRAPDRAALETVVRSLALALERSAAVRALAEEREALAAFARFTELTADTGDVGTLAQRAAEVLHTTLNVSSAAYFERVGGLWKARYVSGAVAPELDARIQAGLPDSAPSLALPARGREPLFFEPWDAAADGLPVASALQAAARYPLFPPDAPAGILGMVTAQRSVWTEREKAVFRAVGDSFRLALERAARVEQLERQRARLVDLNAELGTFITRTAHTLEAPARQLAQWLDLGRPPEQALDGLPPYDPAALHDEVTRLRGVARDLRQLSRLEGRDIRKDLLPLGELFAEVQARVSATPPGSRVYWVTGPLPIVRGDRALLSQALEVLLTFTLSETRGTRYVTVSSREVEGEVQVTVEDDGLGLTGEEAATLFDLAVRTDQSVPVLEGSGLVQVRRILARHGGWAWAEAQRTRGKVVLAFPRDEGVTLLEALLRQDAPEQ